MFLSENCVFLVLPYRRKHFIGHLFVGSRAGGSRAGGSRAGGSRAGGLGSGKDLLGACRERFGVGEHRLGAGKPVTAYWTFLLSA